MIKKDKKCNCENEELNQECSCGEDCCCGEECSCDDECCCTDDCCCGDECCCSNNDEETYELLSKRIQELSDALLRSQAELLNYKKRKDEETARIIKYAEKDILESITITTPPDKTTYKEGQDFDKTGMIVKALYSNGSKKQITDYEIIDGEDLKVDQTEVTIKYLDKEIAVYGWIRKHRKQKEIGFIELSDGTCFKKIQVVYDSKLKEFDEIQKIKFGSAIEVIGILSKSPISDEQLELQTKKNVNICQDIINGLK